MKNTTDSQPFFTIITVFLNDSQKIDLTLNSLYHQTCQDYEHLIKDGCSNASEIELLKRYVLTDKSTIISVPDVGIYSAMNQALGLAKGRFLYFLNAGDAFHDQFVLEKTKKFIHNNSEGNIFYGDVIWTDNLQCTNYREKLTKRYIFNKTICHQGLFVEREKLLEIGSFRERMFLDQNHQAIQSDQESIWKLVLKHKCKSFKLPIRVAFFERGGFSTSRYIFFKSWLERAALLINMFSLAEFIIYGSLNFLLSPLKYSILLAMEHQHTKTFSNIYRYFLQWAGCKTKN